MTPQLRERIVAYAEAHRDQPKWKMRLYALLYALLYGASLVTLNRIK